MKTRNGFVSNSSSSSFVVTIRNQSDRDINLKDWVEDNKLALFMNLTGENEEDFKYFMEAEYEFPWYKVLKSSDRILHPNQSIDFMSEESDGIFEEIKNNKDDMVGECAVTRVKVEEEY